jgi:hypothetical protein
MSSLTANIDIGSKAVKRKKGIYQSTWKQRTGILFTVYRKTGCGKKSYQRCSLKVIMFTVLRQFIPVILLIKGIAVNELNTIVYYSVNSATCFGLTDQHQADQQHNRMWTVIWKCRWQLLTTCIVRLGIYMYIYICIYIS